MKLNKGSDKPKKFKVNGRLGGLASVHKGGDNPYKARRKSRKGHYNFSQSILFIENYKKLTRVDIGLREKYALSLLNKYLNIPTNQLRMFLKEEEITASGKDEVYYVKTGSDVIGKMSITFKKLGGRYSLGFIYRKKFVTKPYKPEKDKRLRRNRKTVTREDTRTY